MKIFNGNESFPLLYKLVSIIFSLPVSNSFVERIFSLVSAQWTKERNGLREKTVKSLLCASLNHRKKTKADGSRLIPRKHTETLVLLSKSE